MTEFFSGDSHQLQMPILVHLSTEAPLTPLSYKQISLHTS